MKHDSRHTVMLSVERHETTKVFNNSLNTADRYTYDNCLDSHGQKITPCHHGIKETQQEKQKLNKHHTPLKKEIIHGILSSTAPDDRPSAVKKEVILADKNPNYN